MSSLRLTLSLCAGLAFLAGCGRSQPPKHAPVAMPQSRATMKIKAIDLKSAPPSCVEGVLTWQSALRRWRCDWAARRRSHKAVGQRR
jgi:hypothetical protein